MNGLEIVNAHLPRPKEAMCSVERRTVIAERASPTTSSSTTRARLSSRSDPRSVQDQASPPRYPRTASPPDLHTIP